MERSQAYNPEDFEPQASGQEENSLEKDILSRAFSAIEQYFAKRNIPLPTKKLPPEHTGKSTYLSKGNYDFDLDAVHLPKDRTTTLHEGIHEILHYLSSAKRYTSESPEKRTSKTGFHSIWKNDVEEITGNYFTSFNEGLTDLLAEEIYIEATGDANVRGTQYGYTPERRLVTTIIGVIAKNESQKTSDVWDELRDAYMSGNIFYLRKVSRALGKDIFEDLAYLGGEPIEPHHAYIQTNLEELKKVNMENKDLAYFAAERQTQNDRTNELNQRIENLNQ
jgi:hypothetical protein